LDRITFNIPGVWTQDIEAFEDERGSFSPILTNEITFSIKETYVAKTNEGYLRGLHFQKPPYAQNKIVCCIDGLIEDIIVDLRRSSPTYGEIITFFMEGDSPYLTHIPAGCAHGYYAYKDSTVIYFMDEVFHPEFYGGIRWNSCLIALPYDVKTSVKDKKLPSICDFETPFI
jgi:dTDP-4-dehydrorhamnose 3,5-epimerase